MKAHDRRRPAGSATSRRAAPRRRRMRAHDARAAIALRRLGFEPGDVVVANDAATLPASLHGVHLPSGAEIEVRLAGRSSLNTEDVRHSPRWCLARETSTRGRRIGPRRRSAPGDLWPRAEETPMSVPACCQTVRAFAALPAIAGRRAVSHSRRGPDSCGCEAALGCRQTARLPARADGAPGGAIRAAAFRRLTRRHLGRPCASRTARPVRAYAGAARVVGRLDSGRGTAGGVRGAVGELHAGLAIDPRDARPRHRVRHDHPRGRTLFDGRRGARRPPALRGALSHSRRDGPRDSKGPRERWTDRRRRHDGRAGARARRSPRRDRPRR